MKKIKLLSSLAILGTLGGSLFSCGETVDVRMGLQNNMGGACGTAAYVKGFFKDEGVNVSQQVLAGPTIAQNLIQGKLDVGFLGNGVAWNYFTETTNIKIFAIDNITDDDRLLANPNSEKAKNLPDANGPMTNYTQLADALAGAKVLFDATTTPGTFFTSLVTEINKQVTPEKQIWWENVAGEQLPATGVTEYLPGRKINVDNNITEANMIPSLSKGGYDFAVGFGSVANTAQVTLNYKIVARSSSHLSTENVVPSTWAVNTDFLEKNSDKFAKFVKGLVRGMDFRHDNPSGTADCVVEVLNGTVEKESIDLNPGYWPTHEDQLEYIADGGVAYRYVDNIRNSQLAGDNASKIVKESSQVYDFSYLKAACEAL